MKKYWLKLLDRNRNKKLDWYEILFPTPDINQNKKVDWWEAIIGIVFMIGLIGIIVSSVLLINYVFRN